MGSHNVNGLEPNIRPSIVFSEKESGRSENKILSSLSSVHSPSFPSFSKKMMEGVKDINGIGVETGKVHLLREGVTGHIVGKQEIGAAQPESIPPLSFTDGARKLFNDLTFSDINFNVINIERVSKEKKTILSLLGIFTNFSKDNDWVAEELRKMTGDDDFTSQKCTIFSKELQKLLVTSGQDAFLHFTKSFNNECDNKWSKLHPDFAQSESESHSEQYNTNQQFCNNHAIKIIKTLTASNASEIEIQTRFRLFRDVFLAQASTLDSGYSVHRYLAEEPAGLTPEIARGGSGDHTHQSERSESILQPSCQIQTVAEIHAPPLKNEINVISHQRIDKIKESNVEPTELQAPDDHESDDRQSINNQKALKTYIINAGEAKLVTNTAFDGLGFLENGIKSTEISKIRALWRSRPTQG